MQEQEKVTYTRGLFLSAEVAFAVDQTKRAKKGWKLMGFERHPRSVWLRILFYNFSAIEATYSREK